METLGVILTLVSVLIFFAAILGLIIPKWVKQPSRKSVLLKLLLPSFILLIVAGILIPTPENSPNVAVTETNKQNDSIISLKENTSQGLNNPTIKPEINKSDKPKSNQQESINLTKKELKKKQKVISSISFMKIRRNMENMTDLQFEEYTKSIKGKNIRWRGYVEDVKEKFFGGYEVLIDMDNPNELISVQDVTFDVSKEQGISLKKNQRIQFEGEISSVLNI